MATGDMTITVTVEGGVSKSVVLDSATRTKIALQLSEIENNDAALQVHLVNTFGKQALNYANTRLETEATWTPKTFTEAT